MHDFTHVPFLSPYFLSKFYNFVFFSILQDVQTKLREQFRGIPDEFMTSNLADRAKVGI